MSRKIYMQELEQEARRKAREARLAFAMTAGGSKDRTSETQHIEDELMELVEQAKAVISRLWVFIQPVSDRIEILTNGRRKQL